MSQRKQQLLRRHRKNKRIAVLIIAVLIGLATVFVSWWCLPVTVLLAWLAHEAWFADHIFYSPDMDYQYSFPEDAQCFDLQLEQGRLKFAEVGKVPVDSTLILQVRLRSRWLGYLFDPEVRVGNDVQTFERGSAGFLISTLPASLSS